MRLILPQPFFFIIHYHPVNRRYIIGVADSVVTPTNRCVHNKVGSNVREFYFNAMNTKRVGLDWSDIYARRCTLKDRNLTTRQKSINNNERLIYESTCLFFKIGELNNWGNKLHSDVFTQVKCITNILLVVKVNICEYATDRLLKINP